MKYHKKNNTRYKKKFEGEIKEMGQIVNALLF